MKKVMIGLLFLFASTSASANFFGSNDGEWKMGPYGPYWEESDWPQWTPMYWMQEMMDSFDDDDNFGGMMPGSNGFNMNMPQYNMQPQYNMRPYTMPPMPAPRSTTPQQAPTITQ